MAQRSPSERSWLETVAALLRHSKNGRKPLTRRCLVAERLERRTVLTAGPVEEESIGGLSLAEYLENEQELGPIAPAEYLSNHSDGSDASEAEPIEAQA